MSMNRRVDPATCSQCSQIFLRQDAPHLSHKSKESNKNGAMLCIWGYTRAELKRSVDAGCPLCRAFQARFREQFSTRKEIARELLHDLRHKLPENHQLSGPAIDKLLSEVPELGGLKISETSESSCEKCWTDDEELWLKITMDLRDIIGIRAIGHGERNFLSFRLLAETSDPAASIVEGRFPPPDVVSQRAFATARNFITTCDESHADCVKLSSSKLPSRVIVVGQAPAVPYVWTTNGAVARYAALSYCWGHNPDCKTTKATLAAHSAALPLGRLPQTILDAITITRELGIPYLWIDALCIVQDDENDVAIELARMVDIYRSAYFTISAASASDSRDGFLADRKLTSVIEGSGPVYLPYKTAAGDDAPVGMVGLVKNSMRGVVRDSIHSRAWTLQEHMLASRLLVYGSVQLICICASKTLQCGDQYSLGNRIDRRHWERLHGFLSPSKRGQGGPVAAGNASMSSEKLLLFHTIGFMFTSVLDSVTEQPFAYRDRPLDKIILEMTMCRLMAELLKVLDSDVETPIYHEPIAETIKQRSEDWSLRYGSRATAEVRKQAAIIIWNTWELINRPFSEQADTFSALPLLWKGLVEEFTSRGLGYHSDKLPALAAIAEVVGTSFKDEYVAGHWRKYLLPQLLWRVAKPAATSRPPANAAAHHPTWSWASLDGQIEMWPFDLETAAKTPVATVVECTTELVHAIVPYGRIKSASLKIRGWLQPVRLSEDGKTATPKRKTCRHDAPIDIWLDQPHQIPEFPRSKNIKWALTLIKVVPIMEWGLGHEDTARGIAGVLVDLTEDGARRVGTFSGNSSLMDTPTKNVAYEDVASLNKRFNWLLAGSQTIVSLV